MSMLVEPNGAVPPGAGGPSAAGPSAAGLIKDTTTAAFRQDVIAESMKQPVLVDFWAPWCGPCKQLTPVLEKAVASAGGKVKLVKMNIDEHPSIAGQLGVQSIPAVFAFDRGQPVDGFMGALPEAQIKAFIERLTGPAGPGPVEEAMAQAAQFVESGDTEAAKELYAAVLAEEPKHVGALAKLAKLHIDGGDLDAARGFLDAVPLEGAKDPAVAAARAALDLADQAASLGDLAEFETRLARDPDDHGARFDLALGLNSRGKRKEATDALLDIVKRDRTWNDDGAVKQLRLFFEAWGIMDPDTVAGRRRLSSMLFS